jgi:hypothetical protein
MNDFEILKNLKTNLNTMFGIEKIAVFGSVARDEANINSDIDIAIIKIKEKNYFIRLEAKEYLEKHLNKKVDLGYFDSMRKVIQESIKKDMIYV